MFEIVTLILFVMLQIWDIFYDYTVTTETQKKAQLKTIQIPKLKDPNNDNFLLKKINDWWKYKNYIFSSMSIIR